MTTKNALVTGAAGFLGRYCSLELSTQGYKVMGLDIIPFTDHKEWGISSYSHSNCDLHSLNDIKSSGFLPDIIIHCAGSGSVASSFQHPHHDFHTNVVTALEVLEFCRQHNSTKLVIPSSAAVYGNATKLPITEDDPLNPMSPYGTHKKIIEDLTKSYATLFKVKASIVRIFSLYGVGLKKQILWDACMKAASGNFSFSGSGEEIRDFLHVTDAAKILIKSAENSSENCPTLNGGTGKGTSIAEIVKIVGRCWKPQLTAIFTGEVRQGDPSHFIANINLLEHLNITALRNLDNEVKNYVEWFKLENKI